MPVNEISPTELKNIVISVVGVSDKDLKETKFTDRKYYLKSVREVTEKSIVARQLISYLAYNKLNMRGEKVKEIYNLINRKHPTIILASRTIDKDLKFKSKRTEMLKNYLSLLENLLDSFSKN